VPFVLSGGGYPRMKTLLCVPTKSGLVWSALCVCVCVCVCARACNKGTGPFESTVTAHLKTSSTGAGEMAQGLRALVFKALVRFLVLM
jgi:hypothetical protein